MAIRNGVPVRFTPKGICDAFDATDAFPGACAMLTNLVFDQGNPENVVSRPGVGAPLTSFASFTTPTFVSVQMVIGTVVYGMVSSAHFAGHDEPFAFDTVAGTFIAITGATSANTPVSPATTGPWTPPTMAVVASQILITHPGYSGTGSNFFGVINISTPAAPTYGSVNLTTNPLTGVPTAVANYNNRAYFAVGNLLEFSDVLSPGSRTNATQSLTVGDSSPITALSGLPIQTTSAGVAAALLTFKSSQIWQITGDTTTSNLALNFITLTTGCAAPRTICQMPFGVTFIGVDGPYVLSLSGVLASLSNQLGAQTPADVQVPFQNATTPSRMAAGFSGNIYRVCVATTIQGVAQTNDYWFDIRRMRWSGPHTFPYDCASQISNSFILSSAANGAALFLSQSVPNSNSAYNDNGTVLSSHLRSSSFPKTQRMQQVQVVESTIELSSSGQAVSYSVSAYSTALTTLNSVPVTTAPSGFTWGSGAVWGAVTSVYSSSSNIPKVYTIPWSAPLVFQKMSLDVFATSSNSLTIGTFFARYQDTGYTNL